MRKVAILVAVLCLVVVSCGDDSSLIEESSADVFIGVELDGDDCTITENRPAFASTEFEELDLIVAQPGDALTVILTNTSDVSGQPKVNGGNETVAEVHAEFQDGGEGGSYLIAKPGNIFEAQVDYSAENLDLAENQWQEDYILGEAATYILIAHTTREIWDCLTSPERSFIIDVPVG